MLLGVQDIQNLPGERAAALWHIPWPILPYITLNIIDGLIATLQHEMIYLNFYSCVLTIMDYGSAVRGRCFTSQFTWAFLRLLSNFHSSAHGQLSRNMSEGQQRGLNTRICLRYPPGQYHFSLAKFSLDQFTNIHYFTL